MEPQLPGAQELLDRLEAGLAPALDGDRYYDWQPLPLLDFGRGLEAAGPGGGRRFLDVGSGIGSKLLLAARAGWRPAGVELRPEYAAVSRRVFPEFSVVVTDAFEYGGYAGFDMVYSYRICKDPEEQDHLNRTIASRMKPGALFFSAGGPYPDWLEPVDAQVWRVPGGLRSR